jgi:50S ribosomal protein L16 3-hydroxylase
MHLEHFDGAAFLADHWQKSPCLIRNPWDQWHNPLEPDELAGLACEPGVESRLILRTGDTWAVEHGPIPEQRFGKIGRKPATLLVQAVDTHVPEVAALITPFRFIPNWRIDDVMVSYATDSGGVGPHFDNYDVFLVQGLGTRRWRVGPRCDALTPLLPHEDLRLLPDFEATDEWLLEPGDILYVPPGFAHDGAAVGGDCMTYSIGFRAPARSELIEGWCDHLVDDLLDDDRYADPDLAPQPNPGEITPAALNRLHAMISDALNDRAAFARWFGAFSSTPKPTDIDYRPEEPIAIDHVAALVAHAVPIVRNAASRFAFIRDGEDAALLFVDGQPFPCAGRMRALAECLCAQDCLILDPDLAQDGDAMALIATLFNQGSIAFENEDED